MNEFVIEKYIEINKGISISRMYKFMLMEILALLVLQYNRILIYNININKISLKIGSTFMYL